MPAPDEAKLLLLLAVAVVASEKLTEECEYIWTHQCNVTRIIGNPLFHRVCGLRCDHELSNFGAARCVHTCYEAAGLGISTMIPWPDAEYSSNAV